MREKNSDIFFKKIDDKIKFCNSKNKIIHTDFFTQPEIIKIEKYLKLINIKNYFFFGGYENADRKILIFYPYKLTREIAFSSINKILKVIRIILPKEKIESFEHRDYLSAIMKLGIVREKFGDIVVYPEGADFVVQKENSEYFQKNLKELTRFKKSNIEIVDIFNLHKNNQNFEEISIVVNSMRIDNFISEICHYSRSKAEKILIEEKVMINYELTTKNSKIVKINDIITIRGYGRFIVKEIARKTKSDKNVVILIHNK